MTTTIVRLILTMLILPTTGAVFLLAVLGAVHPPGLPGVFALLMVWMIVYTFVALYWVALWYPLVRWTRRRVLGTLAIGAGSILLGTLIGAVCFAMATWMPAQLPVLVGGGTVPIIWVLGTVLLWQETLQERIERLGALGTTVICPVCGYNLAGLQSAVCPECGSGFTLDKLIAAQARGFISQV